MKKVLIVDDDNNIIKMYSIKLSNSNYEPLSAMNGKQGLEVAFKIHPDLIVIDLAMPVMDGMAMIKQLRTDPWGKTVPIIILTNFDTNDRTLADVQKFQPSYYLLKANNTPSQIIDKINELLASKNE
jgi:CheY-like chemotaxis protein